MAVSQSGEKRNFSATEVLIELMDEDEEPKWEAKQEQESRGFFNNILRELMLDDYRLDVRG